MAHKFSTAMPVGIRLAGVLHREEEEIEPCEECVACRPLTLDDAWEVLGEMLRDDYREYRGRP